MTSASTLEPVMKAAVPTAEEALYEVVDGKRVELPPMGSYATWITSNLHGYLWPFAKSHQLGTIVSEMLFIIDAERDLRRRPDVAFVSAAKWPLSQRIPKTGDWKMVPDLAVEVISPNDTMEDVIAKLAEYFRFGVQQVWVALPIPEQIYVYDALNRVHILTIDEEIDGGRLLPGFRLPVAAIFTPEPRNGSPVL